MSYLSPWISALEEAATHHPDKLAFKIPICGDDQRTIIGWRSITYRQLYAKIETVAKHWSNTLRFLQGSVVTLWLSGIPFSDILHIFGVMRAGYVPHLLNSEVNSLNVVQAIFKETGSGAVIYAPTVDAASIETLSKHLQCYPATNAEQLPAANTEDAVALNTKTVVGDKDTVVIVHTSGSTSGRLKLVRMRRAWLDVNSHKRPVHTGFSDYSVIPRLGSFCHTGQLLFLVPWIDFTADEIVQMYHECGLKIFLQFTPLFSNTIRFARTNPKLLAVLQSFPCVFFIGGALSGTEIEWCQKNNITLKTSLATTETGTLMTCGENPSLLRLIKVEGCSYEMRPVEDDHDGATLRSPLFELIVHSNSLDCPDNSLCDPQDGHYHTKDVFEKIMAPDLYQYRGRLDDMIKMQNARKCDTKYIEDQVYLLCKDVVSTCIVVGSGKPSPALLVECITTNEKDLIRQIGDKLGLINQGGYPHEQITPDHILLLSPGEIPRTSTKQNIKRAAAEIKFRNQIDALYT